MNVKNTLNIKFLIAFIGYDGVEFFKVKGIIRFNVREDFSDVWKVRQMPLGGLGRSKVTVECSPSTSIIVYSLSYLAALFSHPWPQIGLVFFALMKS